ncbi:fluoride efflux transporter CrcB [Thermoanaerobacterium sp. DL9XJH110]|uniref:fluoride efflux transporter CrcB n=1 Tax=Thermoanaerobacterium sp. DL9XJH110 TaxID=3386643 RepID=UPI003BB7A869
MIIRTLAVGIGSFIGGILRYVISGWAVESFGPFFPYGTLIVNVTGCFIMSFVMTYGAEMGTLDVNIRLFVTTGIMGALTTFSTFSYETFQFLREGNLFFAGLNVILNLFIGLFAVWLGTTLAKILV